MAQIIPSPFTKIYIRKHILECYSKLNDFEIICHPGPRAMSANDNSLQFEKIWVFRYAERFLLNISFFTYFEEETFCFYQATILVVVAEFGFFKDYVSAYETLSLV